MTKRTLLLSIVLTFIALTTAACGIVEELIDKNLSGESNNNTANHDVVDNVDNEDDDTNDEVQNDSETDIDQDNNNDNTINDGVTENVDENDDQSSATSGTKELPEAIEIDEQIQHPNGVIFTLERISFKDDHITVDFNAQNGYGHTVYLANEGRARSGKEGGITLRDDTDFIYRYVADEEARIKLSDNEEVSGTASFFGRIQDDAQSMTLIFNPNGKEKEKNTNRPKFVFENIKIER